MTVKETAEILQIYLIDKLAFQPVSTTITVTNAGTASKAQLEKDQSADIQGNISQMRHSFFFN